MFDFILLIVSFSKHIPTAQFFDQNRCAIREEIGSLPEPECFSAYAQALGVSRSRQVVLYDRGGMASAARAWLTFRVGRRFMNQKDRHGDMEIS